MTLRQTLQAAPVKTNAVIAKLADTSNTAVKTREKLLGELAEELRLYLELETRHLFPVLRKHDETKALVADATRAARALTTLLGELEAAPRDGGAFAEKLGELRRTFQQHLRDERSELLPAVLKALEIEEANELAARIEASAAEAERVKREAAQQEREAAAHERESADARAEAERTAARAQRAAARSARAAGDQRAGVAEDQVQTAQAAGRELVLATVRGAEASTDALAEAVDTNQASTNGTDDLRAATSASGMAARGMADIGLAWTEWFSEAARTSAEAARQLMQCRTLPEVAEAQRALGATMLRNWMGANVRAFEAAQQISKQAMAPLNARLQSHG